MSFQKACITDVAKDLVWFGLVQGAVKSSYCGGVRVTKRMRRSPEALRLVDKINDEAASSDSASARGDLGVSDLINAVPFTAEKHDVLLYIETAAAHIRGCKQSPPSMDVLSIPMPPVFCKSSSFCPSLCVKSIDHLSTRLCLPMFCKPRSLFCM